MAALKLPKHLHPDFRQPNRKPTGPVQIDWGNPLTKGLVRFWTGAGKRALTGEPVDVVANGTVTDGVFNGDRAYVFSANSSTRETVDTPISGGQHRTYLGEIFQTQNTAGYIFNINPDAGGSGSTGGRWSVRQDQLIGLRVEIQGSGYTSALNASNGRHFVGCRLDGSTLGDHTLFVDGQSEAAAGATAVVTQDTSRIRLGGRDNAGASVSPVEAIFWGALWDRALSDVEIDSIRRNPYQLLKPAPDAFFLPQAAPDTRSVTASQTEAGDTTAATVETLRRVAASQIEEGDATVADINAVQARSVTASQTEEGDTTVAAVAALARVAASQTEEGDATIADVNATESRNVAANQIEAGDTTAATVETLRRVAASQLEEGDSTVAAVAAIVRVTASQIEEGDTTVAAVIVVPLPVSVTASQLEAGDTTVASILSGTLPPADGTIVVLAQGSTQTIQLGNNTYLVEV